MWKDPPERARMCKGIEPEREPEREQETFLQNAYLHPVLKSDDDEEDGVGEDSQP